MMARLATAVFLAGAMLVPGIASAGGTMGTHETTTSAKSSVGDAAITTKVKAKLATDRQVSAMNIHVDTDNGIVKLSGDAKTQAEADRAAEIAKNTEGVASVTNDIRISSAGTKY